METQIKGKDTYQYLLSTASADKWKRCALRKRAGVLAPLFSFYSKNSLGIGDLGDLKLLVDLAALTGNSIIQLLPMNEVGPVFCPYDSLSSFALEPAYLNIGKFPGVNKDPLKSKAAKIRKDFPAGQGRVDWGIKKAKCQLLKDIFKDDDSLSGEDFRIFVENNIYWINDFALFKALRDLHRGAPWYEWEDQYKNRDNSAIEKFSLDNENEILFQIWAQWQLYKQFKEVKDYAEAKKILIKGDLPILVSMDSADVWAHPDFFKVDLLSGAPPDMYCAKGQRWGMPTYNWKNISNDGYRYLKQKIKYAENFYDVLRIDHVVGLFRIWSIPYNDPADNLGLNGFFDPADEKLWEGQGRDILKIILENTKMLLCAEDLGTIPESCPRTLKDLGVPGNDVQRWVKDWKIKHDFLPPEEYRFLSVAVLSTHDTTNWPAWWENEAGTLDEGFFMRKCAVHKIDYNQVKNKLFDSELSRHGRLRWKDNITCADIFLSIIDKGKEESADLIGIYEDSYWEKDKLWKDLKMKGPMTERCGKDLIAAVLKMALESKAVFSIQSIVDWLSLGDIFKGDPYQYRINTPGTISEKNWSLVIPSPLEKLLQHKICKDIKKIINASGRIKKD